MIEVGVMLFVTCAVRPGRCRTITGRF